MSENSENRVFLSYRSTNSKEADRIDKDLQEMGITISRDIRDVNVSESFKAFMQRIREHEYVLVLLSEDYLKSEYCLFELMELKKDRNYWDKLIIITVGDIKDSAYYLNYWQAVIKKERKKLEGIDPAKTADTFKKISKWEKYTFELDELIAEINDRKCFKFEEIVLDYKPLLKKLNISDYDQTEISEEDFGKQIEKELRPLSSKQKVSFAWHCAVLALPVLGNKGNFEFWKKENRQKHLSSVFWALDCASTVRAAASATEAYTSVAYFAVRAAAADAAYTYAYAAVRATAYAAAADTSADAAYAAARALSALSYVVSGFDKNNKERNIIKIIRDILESTKNNTELKQINYLDLYGEVWDNFLKALEKEDCVYWADLYRSIFENNFRLNKAELEKRLNIPEEIREQGASAVGKYMTELAKGAETLNEARIIMLGDKGSGKTSISRRLAHPEAKMPELSESTPGVDTILWKTDDNINVHIWDFAGHTITHSVHKFFLSERCLYIMVYDGRTESKNNIEYWLNFMKSYGGESKAIILINKKDEHLAKISVNTLKETYKIEKVFNFSVQDDLEDLNSFRQYVSNYIKDNPTWNKQLIPARYYRVKEDLEKLFFKCETGNQKEYIGRREFEDLAQRYEEKSPEDLLSHLNCLGIILWYPKLKKYNTLVLNPEWISHGIYRIINWLSNRKKYQITLDDLFDVFKEDLKRYPEGKHEFLYDLMKYYELAFEYVGEQEHCLILPHLLEEDRPEELPPFSIEESLMLRYKSEMDLPPDTISRFIVRHSKEIKDVHKLVWRFGVILQDTEGSLALVREENRVIAVTVKGTNKSNFIKRLRDTLESIFASYKREKPGLEYKIEEFGRLPEQKGIWLSENEIYDYLRLGRQYFIASMEKNINLEDIAKEYKINKEEPRFRQSYTLENTDDLNIEDGNYVVVKADVEKYSEQMRQGHGETITIKLRELVSKHCIGFKHFKVKDGDSFSIIHTDVDKMVKTVIRILEDLIEEHPMKPLLRIAVDFGRITTNDKNLLRSVARIEPKVKPGEVWVTDRLKALLNPRNQGVLEDLGKVKINKPTEPDEFEHMYRFPG